MMLSSKSLILTFFLLQTQLISANECGESGRNNFSPETIVTADLTTFRKITPKFFGFNLELIEFQNSLWNKDKKEVDPTVIKYLQRFPGAIYRYPGGTVANQFDWFAAIGPTPNRLAQQIVNYQNARVVEFGPSEYLYFVSQVNGTAWYVLNLYGSIQGPMKTKKMATSAANLMQYMHTQHRKGLPDIYRWELGNELDRGRYQWSASKYADVAGEIGASAKPYLGDSNMVNMAQDWSHTGASLLGIDYNAFTAKMLNQVSSEFASHLYYDGAPWGPPVPRLIKQLCKNLAAIRSSEPSGSIWVTEHGRAPIGTPADPNWKNNWRQTADLSAAISSVDMMISLARTRNINGAFIHSLHGTAGPWPIFHKQNNGSIYPSTVYWALVLLRESLLEDVLTSTNSVTVNSTNETGYNTNAVILTNTDRSKFAIWLANRGALVEKAQIIMPWLANKKLILNISSLTSKDLTDNNYTEPYKIFPMRQEVEIDVDPDGKFSVDIAGFSVSTISFSVKK